ncbi:MAG: hypothetical protein POG24_04350 [Acidocella sp.]|jgi:hypothetical protein|nr:hypothetical protein [Acidocella sp.]
MTTKPIPKPAAKPEYTVVAGRKLSKGQLAYEQERAKAAGKSLEAWITAKIKAEEAEAQKAKPKPVKKPGLISRLLDKAHKPI